MANEGEPIQPSSADEIAAAIERAIASGGSVSTTQARPIGVPTVMRDPVTNETVPFSVSRDTGRTYGVRTASPNTPTTRVNIPPTFFEGDEYMPSSWSREDIGRLQMALRNAGLVGPRSTFRLGVWDETSRGAYRKLLEYANGAGHTDPLEALRDYAATKAEDVVGDERAPLTVRLSNPMDLRRVADVAIPAVTGRKMDAAQLDKIIAAYQQKEREEQESLYAADVTGGTVTQAPDFQSFAQGEARRLDPQGAAEYDAIQRSNDFFDLLMGSGG